MQFVDHVSGYILRRDSGVVIKEFLAVNQYLLHLLAVSGNFTVAAHFHAGQALEQVLNHGIGLSLVGVGIKFHGVFLDGNGCLDAHHHGLLEQNGVIGHLYHTHIHVAAVAAHAHALDHVVVAYVAELQVVVSGLHFLDVKHAVLVGHHAFHQCAVLVGLEQLHSGLNERQRVIGIYQQTVDVACRITGDTHQQGEQQCDSFEYFVHHCVSLRQLSDFN